MDNSDLIKSTNFALVKQKLFKSKLKDLADTLAKTLANLTLDQTIKPGQSVAVAVGSRGISQIDNVLYRCLQFLKDKKLKPYIVPAMGSHGGGTVEGQLNVLAKLEITESTMKVPILADMDVTGVGELSCGTKIFLSQRAMLADHIVVINRVKPHTKFRADIESGLCKMLTMGLGKNQGAAELHRCAVYHTFGIIEEAARTILKKGRILFGLALLEDGYGNLASIEAVSPSALIEREKQLLKDAWAMMGRIPFDFVDILIIDIIGKNISGIGMDSNITGRHRDIVGDFIFAPHVKRIFVRDLSPQSDGNGNGIGLADITTKRLVEALDMAKAYANALTAISPEKAAIPIHFDTDRQALEACALTAGLASMTQARVVRIKDTASLEMLQVSTALKQEVLSNPDLEQLSPWKPMAFDEQGDLRPLSHGL
jgi:hypothetical protein